MAILSCILCDGEFEAKSAGTRYCSVACRSIGKAAPKLTCCLCGEGMVNTRTSRPQGTAAHNKCRISIGGLYAHGASGYHNGCRCDTCKQGHAENMRAYVQKHRDKHGVGPSATSRRAFREANGYWPNKRGSDWIHPRERLELYERDAWTCYLCLEQVDRDGDPNGNSAPSLDHVVPRSHGGTHEPSNLKTACRACNSRRGATYDPI